LIALHAPEVAGAVKAGQFVNLGITPGPLLRRPFSVYRAEGEEIEVILKAVAPARRSCCRWPRANA